VIPACIVQARAARRAYIYWYYAIPAAMLAITFEPVLRPAVPNFPLYILGALAIGQQLVFWTVIRKLDECPEEDLTPPGRIH
jgi:hypothetical protein